MNVSSIGTWGRGVSLSDRRPGDLIIYRACAAGNISHVSLYVGRNKNTGAAQEVKAFFADGAVGLYENPSACTFASAAIRVQG